MAMRMERKRYMKNILSWIIVLNMIIVSVETLFAQEDIVEMVAEECKEEIETYFSNITAGQGRIHFCLFTYSDKLSARCKSVFNKVVKQLERSIATQLYIQEECKEELNTYCATIPAEQVYLSNCLHEKEKNLSDRCSQALKEVGLK
jgi:hypothetical protein